MISRVFDVDAVFHRWNPKFDELRHGIVVEGLDVVNGIPGCQRKITQRSTSSDIDCPADRGIV
jgi:hypothetical protein